MPVCVRYTHTDTQLRYFKNVMLLDSGVQTMRNIKNAEIDNLTLKINKINYQVAPI